ncbi:hypothetical protein [uncultured Sneathiella sp.]|uniref:hypothetical protein n=1 Tax=uncultured Sneathiella sp. TaxID=879315 RepID=UPI0030EC6F2D|tara:strand:- start:3379 stop:3651 length:273 start_codon:yes stop_codon:yes gene_type:complete
MRVTILGVKEEKRYAPPVHELFQKAHLKKGALGTQIPSLHRISDACSNTFCALARSKYPCGAQKVFEASALRSLVRKAPAKRDVRRLFLF